MTKKQKEAQKKAMQEAKEKREAVGTDRMAPEVSHGLLRPDFQPQVTPLHSGNRMCGL